MGEIRPKKYLVEGYHPRRVAVPHENAARGLAALVQHVGVGVDHPRAQRPAEPGVLQQRVPLTLCTTSHRQG